MIEAGWSRPAQDVTLHTFDLVRIPPADLQDLQRRLDSGDLRARGVEVWNEDGPRRRFVFRFPAEVPCVTTLEAR